ncbi:hypothetical protein L0665_05110 [Methanogenium marinum]|uniref:Uncharacterized protein n=1 Tax=Methanogenium marinum TaxID=348610 RepID=A0A9Q4KTZ7_9EURY|nr:hypothetical protein [Methanogenium marinum]MDE4907987.1 hypothetical protein [Methanogenium marinum]
MQTRFVYAPKYLRTASFTLWDDPGVRHPYLFFLFDECGFMVSEYYKNAEGWGVFIGGPIAILYVLLNIYYNHSIHEAPISGWIYVGPFSFIVSAGLFIYLHLISRRNLTEEEDIKKAHQNYLIVIASLIGFFTWLLVLVILDLIHLDINVLLSVLCGNAVILLLYYLLRASDNKRSKTVVNQ